MGITVDVRAAAGFLWLKDLRILLYQRFEGPLGANDNILENSWSRHWIKTNDKEKNFKIKQKSTWQARNVEAKK